MSRLTIFATIVGHILVPAAFVFQVGSNGAPATRIACAAFLLAYVGYLRLVGRWDWFGTWLRTFWSEAALVVTALCAVDVWHAHVSVLRDLFSVMVFVPLALYFVAMARVAARGRRYDRAAAVNLARPLRNGRFYVAHGGSTSAVNYHVANPTQRGALDIVKLGGGGRRARGLLPRELTRYAIFGEPIYCPAHGIVLHVVNDRPDLPPPDRDPAQPAGNCVVIQPDGRSVYVLLAHLQQGSVLVRQGDVVQAGQPIGRVGNSGNTTEPHLHIHCAKIAGDNYVSGGDGMPITFDGRYLVRNDVV